MYSVPHLIMISLIVLLMAMCSQIDAADKATLDKICKQSQDYNFCMKSFNGDLRTPTADLDGLARLSIAHTIDQVRATSEKLRGVKAGDPVGQKRLAVCKSDYLGALDKFNKAFAAANKKDYYGVLNLVRDGTNLVIDCQDIYRRGEPIGVSPVADDNNAAFKLSGIILVIVDMLLPH